MPTSDTPPLWSINFQPASSVRPYGFQVDSGQIFDPARGWGWDAPVSTRERGTPKPQTLDTFALTHSTRTWQLALPNGQYDVWVAVGDPSYSQGAQRLVVEGQTVVHDESTAAGQFIERRVTVSVTDGNLTLQVGGASGTTCLDYVVVAPAPPATD